MRYMLDTNICRYLIKRKPVTVLGQLAMQSPEDICISAITYGELLYGAYKSSFPERNLLALQLFLATIDIIPVNALVCDAYGIIRTSLEKNGIPIGPNDTWISAHALSQNCVLVTNNIKEFSRVQSLRVENWTI